MAVSRPVGSRAPFVLSGALGVAALIGAGLSLLVPDLLGGVPVGKGNLRGTALVVVTVAVPLLLAALAWTAKGSVRGLTLWLGAAAYLTYQGVLFCFATPINNLFFAYVAQLGLGLWTLVWLLAGTDLVVFAGRVDDRMPLRVLAGVSMGLTSVFALVWLRRAIPAVFGADPTSAVRDIGLLTNPLWVQDFAFWFPAAFLAGIWMWRGRAAGVLLTGAFLTYDVVEALGIASDQWWGALADDRFPDVASMAAVPVFVILAGLMAIPLVWQLRHLDRGVRANEGTSRSP